MTKGECPSNEGHGIPMKKNNIYCDRLIKIT